MNIWTRYIGGYIQGTRFIMYILDISRSFFSLKRHLKLTKKQSTLVGNWVSLGGLNYFWSYFCPCYFQYRVKLDRKISSQK